MIEFSGLWGSSWEREGFFSCTVFRNGAVYKVVANTLECSGKAVRH